MDKSQDAIAPPNTTLNEPPPPFPGVGTSSQFSGGFQAPPDSGLVTGKKENNILNIMVIKRYCWLSKYSWFSIYVYKIKILLRLLRLQFIHNFRPEQE